jgi:hypothetical protein
MKKKSTILATNINFNAWDDVFYDPVIANVILVGILKIKSRSMKGP